MEKRYFDVEKDGFYGAYYPNPKGNSTSSIIAMLGDAVDDRMAVSGVRWLHRLGCNVMAMAPAKKDYSHLNYPLERFGCALQWLKENGSERFGVMGGSTTGMLALIAASCYPEFTLTLGVSPSDFVMEGFQRDGLDGAEERPGDHGESTVSWEGKPLPYLPFAYRHPVYWQKIREESKAGGNAVASRELFDESEHRHPLQEEEKIKAERICGRVILIGAEDDCLWDTCRYIRRMEQRLKERPHACSLLPLTFPHGTHFLFPQSLMKIMLPVGSGLLVSLMFREGRKHPKECKQARQEVDRILTQELRQWSGGK